MAISVITDWTILINEGSTSATATLPTFSAGSDRIVELAFDMYNGAGNTNIPTTVTANGESAALVDGHTTAQSKNSVGVYQFLESQISTINGQTLTSSSGSGSQKSVYYRVLGGGKQILPTAFGKAYAASASALTISLTRAASSYTTVVSVTSASGSTITTSNPTNGGILTKTSNRRFSYGSAADTANTSDTTATGQLYTSSVAYNRESAPLQIITSVNDGAGIKAGSSGNTAVVTGFASDPTSGNIGGKAFTEVSYSAGTVTFSMPAYSDDAVWPLLNSSATVIISDGTNSPVLDGVSLLPPEGWAVVTISAPVTDNLTFLGAHTDLSNHEVAYDLEVGSVALAADGGFTKVTAGTRNLYKRDLATGVLTLLIVTIDDSGAITIGQRKKSMWVGLGMGI